MRINGIEKLSLVDFEGKMACTVFCGGCNFRCPFCHNSALVFDNNADTIDEEEIFAYLRRRKKILDAVVVSGGEPTLDPDLKNFIGKIKELGYLIKLDTNGFRPSVLKDLVNSSLVDYVAMDIKSSLSGYSMATGIDGLDTEKICESVRFLMEDHVDYEFRTTLVYEIHDKSDIEEMALWLKGAKRLFLQHFVDSGDCIADGLSAVPPAKAKEYRDILARTVNVVQLRNY